MSHPETMLNVLRHCVKLLRQQQSKKFPLKTSAGYAMGLRPDRGAVRAAEPWRGTAGQRGCLRPAPPCPSLRQPTGTLQATPTKNHWPFSLETSFFNVVSQD